MSYLGSSFTSVPSRPWWSDGPWMSTSPVFAGGPTRSNGSLKQGHDVTVLGPCFRANRATTCTSPFSLRYLLWDRQALGSRLPLGDQQGPGGRGRADRSEDFKKVRRPHMPDPIEKDRDRDKHDLLSSASPWSPASYEFQCVLESISQPVGHIRSEMNVFCSQCVTLASPIS